MKFTIEIKNDYELNEKDYATQILDSIIDNIDTIIADYAYETIDEDNGYEDLGQENYNKIFNGIVEELIPMLQEELEKEYHTEGTY